MIGLAVKKLPQIGDSKNRSISNFNAVILIPASPSMPTLSLTIFCIRKNKLEAIMIKVKYNNNLISCVFFLKLNVVAKAKNKISNDTINAVTLVVKKIIKLVPIATGFN